jgi:OOP family OmpA-OmpF porin
MLNREIDMHKYYLATTALLLFAAPAAAKDGSWYAGLDAGVLFPKSPSGGNLFADYTTTNATVPSGGILPGGIPAGPASATFNSPFDFKTNTGLDVDVVGGYDFGWFRVEGELGYKHSHLDSNVDSAFLTSLNTALNRPSGPPDPGAPGLGAITASDFNLDDKIHAWSAMVNGLVDLGGQNGFGGYFGAGAGYAEVHGFDDSKGKFAWQLIAGVYYPISDNIDIGIKGRYFDAGSVGTNDTLAFAGNPNRLAVGAVAPVLVDQTTSAALTTDEHAKFRAFSLLASVTYNFGSPAPPPPPPMALPPAPPPAAAPATQTCGDGSVILATDSCPAPPPPPPPPAPAPAQRG